MKKILLALAIAATTLTANAMTVTDKVEDAIAEAIRRLPDVVGEIAEANTVADSATEVTLYSDTTDEELADDTAMVSSSAPTTYKYSYEGDECSPWEYVVAIVAIVCVILVPILCIFGFPILIIWLIARSRRKRERERNAIILEMAKEGRDVTPLINNAQRESIAQPRANDDLYGKGVKNICVGVGVGVLLWVIMGRMGIAIGFVIVCVGVSQLLTSKRNAASAPINAEPEATANADSYNKEERTQEAEPVEGEEKE